MSMLASPAGPSTTASPRRARVRVTSVAAAVILATSAAQPAQGAGLVVGSSTADSGTATASSSQRRNFKDTATDTSWLFWYDGTAIAYASSPDGRTWTQQGTLAHDTSAFAVTYAEIGGIGYVFVAVQSTSALGDVALLRGTLTADSVTFGPQVTVLDGTGVGDAYVRPTVAVDGSGYVWVAAQHDDGVHYQAVALRTTNAGNGDISVMDVASSVGSAGVQVRDTVLVPQGGARMALVLGAPEVTLFVYDGGSWSGAQTGGAAGEWDLQVLDSTTTRTVYAVAVLAGDVYVGGDFHGCRYGLRNGLK